MKFILKYGKMWARNRTNIELLPRSAEKDGQGVYVLYDGTMPVYIGKGYIHKRIVMASKSIRRGQLWDFFSWYSIPDSEARHNVEALLLRQLPWYLRGLNRQSARLIGAKKVEQKDDQPDKITGKPHRPKSKKSRHHR